MFDGQSIMHGVTPITYESELSYRFSIVYYSLKNIWACLEIDDELARIRNKKTIRERNRATMPEEHKETLLKALKQQQGRKAKYENSHSNTEQK